MSNYGKITTGTAGTTALASTGAAPILGLPAVWTLALAVGIVLVGAVAIRVSFRRARAIGQR